MIMDLCKKFVRDPEMLRLLSTSSECMELNIVFDALRKQLEILRNKQPTINDVDIERDFRYREALMDEITSILAMPEHAKKRFNKATETDKEKTT